MGRPWLRRWTVSMEVATARSVYPSPVVRRDRADLGRPHATARAAPPDRPLRATAGTRPAGGSLGAWGPGSRPAKRLRAQDDPSAKADIERSTSPAVAVRPLPGSSASASRPAALCTPRVPRSGWTAHRRRSACRQAPGGGARRGSGGRKPTGRGGDGARQVARSGSGAMPATSSRIFRPRRLPFTARRRRWSSVSRRRRPPSCSRRTRFSSIRQSMICRWCRLTHPAYRRRARGIRSARCTSSPSRG